jgi:hypothetical protein
MKTSRVQAAIKILKSSAEEFNLDEKSKDRKAATVKKAKKVVRKLKS